MSPPLPPGWLSPNFTLAELTASQEAARRGIDNTPGPDELANLFTLAACLEDIRTLCGNVPLLPSSGFRCKRLNRAIGSSDTSAHVLGLACDFAVPRFGTPLQVAHLVATKGPWFIDQVIFEGTWVHVGLAPRGTKPRRQVLTAVFRPGKRTTYQQGLPA